MPAQSLFGWYVDPYQIPAYLWDWYVDRIVEQNPGVVTVGNSIEFADALQKRLPDAMIIVRLYHGAAWSEWRAADVAEVVGRINNVQRVNPALWFKLWTEPKHEPVRDEVAALCRKTINVMNATGARLVVHNGAPGKNNRPDWYAAGWLDDLIHAVQARGSGNTAWGGHNYRTGHPMAYTRQPELMEDKPAMQPELWDEYAVPFDYVEWQGETYYPANYGLAWEAPLQIHNRELGYEPLVIAGTEGVFDGMTDSRMANLRDRLAAQYGMEGFVSQINGIHTYKRMWADYHPYWSWAETAWHFYNWEAQQYRKYCWYLDYVRGQSQFIVIDEDATLEDWTGKGHKLGWRPDPRDQMEADNAELWSLLTEQRISIQTVAPEPEPEPPIVIDPPGGDEMIDMTRYFKMRRGLVTHLSSDEYLRCEYVSDGSLRLWKNENYEHKYVHPERGVYFGEDMSASPADFYVPRTGDAYGVRWCPAKMRVGDVVGHRPVVEWRHKSNGELKHPPEQQPFWVRLAAHYPTYRTPNGITLDDVIEIHVFSSDEPPGENAKPFEAMFYTAGLWLVGWRGLRGRHAGNDNWITDVDVAVSALPTWIRETKLPFNVPQESVGGSFHDVLALPVDEPPEYPDMPNDADTSWVKSAITPLGDYIVNLRPVPSAGPDVPVIGAIGPGWTLCRVHPLRYSDEHGVWRPVSVRGQKAWVASWLVDIRDLLDDPPNDVPVEPAPGAGGCRRILRDVVAAVAGALIAIGALLGINLGGAVPVDPTPTQEIVETGETPGWDRVAPGA